MKIIETSSLLEREISNTRWTSPGHLDLMGYKNLSYECGCGHAHLVNGMDGSEALMASPVVKVLFGCRNDYATFVHIKGIFGTTAISLWSCRKEVLEDVLANM